MTTSEISRRRRALYTGMQPFFTTEQLRDALDLWDRKYAQNQVFSAKFFVAELARVMPQKFDAEQLTANISDALDKPESEGYARQAPQHARARKMSGTTSRATPEVEAFKLLVVRILRNCPREIGLPLRDYVLAKATSLAVPLQLKWQIIKWLGGESSTVRIPPAREDDLRLFINLFYIGLCELVGPVEADAMLSDAVRQLRANGAGEYFRDFVKLL